ncbi:hypothetical protein [Photobacterium ganghwense]|uniref:hypothetical protein n=1 Tax=Photobacterium ganghwense TaxID=320778 RepID=UPI001C2D7C6F|nr:hypothetical protein [Photobacterium ganghwense]MBV1842212.1 hypothetical protein [Photobacterium ganghwense]
MKKNTENHVQNGITRPTNKVSEKKDPKGDSTRIPALIIGGALIGNWIAPGVGGAIVGGIVGGIVGRNKPDTKKKNSGD